MSNALELAQCGEIPVSFLECKEAFELLSDKEKLYAHYLSKASWAGAPIVLQQVSVESPDIFQFFLRLFRGVSLDDLKKNSGVEQEEWDNLMHYISNFFGNMGNYLSFGDTKFLPEISADALRKIVASRNDEGLTTLFEKVEGKMYSLTEPERALNIPPQGVSTYYSPDIRVEDIELVQRFMQAKKINAYNTRIFKVADDAYELRLACSQVSEPEQHGFEGKQINVVRGDYHQEMAGVVENLKLALPHCANEHQTKMVEQYIAHFEGGNIDAHKNAQRHWIKDVGPVVESNIGFIESYRDPFGVRGEFESFVSIVDKKASERLTTLVDNAERFLTHLPWSSTYEKDSFTRPDFTSLCVVTFASSGIPSGINIPNYDDIRQTEGFKNVSLGNVLSATPKDRPVPFLTPDDEQLLKQLKGPAFEVQVALHELLGHGSGKLFMENEDGSFTFDRELVNPFTKEKVASWYKPGETYDEVFKTLGSPMEECRAECVGLYLCVIPEILKLFEVEATTDKACDISYVNWLLLIYAGLRALEFYSPETNKWRQAHMQARHAIMRVLLQDSDVLTIEQTEDNAILHFNREKLLSHAVPAVGEFLHQIMVYKATADFAGASQLFEKFTSVDEKMLALREIVLKKKQPRQVFVQANTSVDADQKVSIATYEASGAGMIQSFLERYEA